MSDETSPSFDLEHRPPGNPTPVGIPSPEDASAEAKAIPPAARPRRTARPTRAAEATADLPALFRPWFFLLLASLLSATWWLGFTNPVQGVFGSPTCWPWELFRAHLAEGGEPIFAWDLVRSIAVTGAFFVLFWLVLAIVRTSPRRGVAALIGVGLGAAAFQGWDRNLLALAVPVGAAAVAGATLARFDGDARRARGVLLGAILILAGALFFPLPVAVDAGWIPQARGISLPIQDLVRGDLPFAGPDRLMTADALHALLLALLVVVGLLALFARRRRRLFARLAAVLVLALVFAPPLAARLFGLADARPAEPDFLAVLSDPAWLGLVLAGMLLLVGVASRLGLGRHGAAWLAGILLFLLVFDVGSVTFRHGVKEVLSPRPGYDGLVYLTRFLTISLGAFLLPLAAGILDVTRGRGTGARGD